MATASGELLLEVSDLRTHLDTKNGLVRAVDGVSFRLHAGETLGIIGESGSGKSMTALSILRVVPKPAARIVGGTVMYRGRNLLERSEREMRRIRGREIAMILQDPQTSLNPVFTVGNQIVEALRIHRRRDGRGALLQRAIEALEQVRIAAPEERIRSYPHQMSGGMKQRAVGAMAISCNPRIIVADEPTTSLDVTIQAQYLRLLRDLQREAGLAMLFITHDFGIVAKLCQRLLVMYAGRVVEAGPVRAVFDNPSHPYTHALLGSVVRPDARVERLQAIEGQPPALWGLPPGCRFAPRCPYADDRCRAEYPPAIDVRRDASDHVASCWKLENPEWKPARCSKPAR